ncbi:MAG TPA: hypothetical protein VGJ05_06030 [Fimbriiglobus sp.]|jgi:hypothetical protein
MSAAIFNGRQPPPQQRKQLSDQLDRFDQILDGLSEGLQGAITDAAREGTRTAVREAIREVLTDPTLRAVLEKLAAPVPAEPTVWQKMRAQFARLKAGVARLVAPVVVPVVAKVRACAQTVGHVARTLGIAWQLKKMLAVGVGIGLMVMGISYLCSHGVAAVLSGIGGAVAAVAVQIGLWVKKSVNKFRLA